MTLFLVYIKQNRRTLILFALFVAVFSASFALYRLPLKAVLYPTVLCAVFGLAFSIADFSRERGKHVLLSEIKKLSAAMISAMPPAESIEARDYQEVIRALQNEVAALDRSTAARYQDLTDYYTAWVHQIKTPITSMRLTLQKEDTPLSRRLTADLFQIEQYVEMVMAFIRLDSSESDYVFREYRLDTIVRSSVAKFASEFIDRKIGLSYEPIQKSVVTDEKWLSFVIEQLLSNALKYTRGGTIRIYLQAPMTLCIEDSGIGIAAEDLPRIFEKGYTGYNGRRDKKASGLGLYLCKRICGNLGVGIRVASEPGRGTTVLLDLDQYELKNE